MKMAAPYQSPECPVCIKPIANIPNKCSFCHKSFVRADVTRRHARSCQARGGRPLPPQAKRGRKLRACDNCSRSKLSCNSGIPCARCSSRHISCTYSALCHDASHQSPTTVDEPPKDGRLNVSFLLQATDPIHTSMDVAVAGEPEKTSEIPAWNHREPETTGCVTGTVDPKFLLLNLSDMLLDEPQDYEQMDQEFLQFSKLFSTPVTSVDTLTARVTSLSNILQDLAINKPHLKEGLDQSYQRGFFTTVHFQNALTFAFRWRYYHKLPIHWPTFDPDRASLHLLLAVGLTGTAYLQYLDQSSQSFLTTSVLELSEKYIFKELKRLTNQDISPVTSRHMLEVCQAAVLMNSLEGSFNHIEGRRRLAGNRIPTLVASLRKSGMLSLEHPPQWDTWEEFVYWETCIRVSTWTFVNDSLMVLCCNNPPIMTVKEMTGHLPCPNDLWEADSDITFQERARHRIARSHPSRCSEIVSGILSAEWTISQAESFRSLDVSDLFYISAGTYQVLNR